MKKLLIFGVIIVVLFGGLAFVTNYEQKEKAAGNPYGKDDLKPATIDQLDDPNYQNLILPEELEKKMENKDDFTVYFYSPTCEHCKQTTPELMPVAEEVGVDIHQFNLLEYEDGWNTYNIKATPTLMHFKDGQEVERVVGSQKVATFKNLLTEWKSE